MTLYLHEMKKYIYTYIYIILCGGVCECRAHQCKINVTKLDLNIKAKGKKQVQKLLCGLLVQNSQNEYFISAYFLCFSLGLEIFHHDLDKDWHLHVLRL